MIEQHQHHHGTEAPEAPVEEAPKTPYERLALAVSRRNAVIERHARELSAAEGEVASAMTAVRDASKAPKARAAGRGRGRGRGRAS